LAAAERILFRQLQIRRRQQEECDVFSLIKSKALIRTSYSGLAGTPPNS
jgi:hypothetical protein